MGTSPKYAAGVGFVVDVFARRIVGWHISHNRRCNSALHALEPTLYTRRITDELAGHCDRGMDVNLLVSVLVSALVSVHNADASTPTAPQGAVTVRVAAVPAAGTVRRHIPPGGRPACAGSSGRRRLSSAPGRRNRPPPGPCRPPC